MSVYRNPGRIRIPNTGSMYNFKENIDVLQVRGGIPGIVRDSQRSVRDGEAGPSQAGRHGLCCQGHQKVSQVTEQFEAFFKSLVELSTKN